MLLCWGVRGKRDSAGQWLRRRKGSHSKRSSTFCATVKVYGWRLASTALRRAAHLRWVRVLVAIWFIGGENYGDFLHLRVFIPTTFNGRDQKIGARLSPVSLSLPVSSRERGGSVFDCNGKFSKKNWTRALKKYLILYLFYRLSIECSLPYSEHWTNILNISKSAQNVILAASSSSKFLDEYIFFVESNEQNKNTPQLCIPLIAVKHFWFYRIFSTKDSISWSRLDFSWPRWFPAASRSSCRALADWVNCISPTK